MVEAGAQKRKAEDETAALASDTLGESSASPAAKKVKTEQEAAPATTQPAATDPGLTETINEVHDAAQEVKVEDGTSSQEKLEEDAEDAEAQPEINNAELRQASEDATAGSDLPQTLGYKTFTSGATAFQYFHELINDLRHDQDVNEVDLRLAK